MEIREYAMRVVTSEDLETKLAPPPDGRTDDAPGPALLIEKPGRPANLAIVNSKAARTPAIDGMADPVQRRRILHAFANHELQAVELFAWALLAFPGTPTAFRRGLLRILVEEQEHCRLYLDRLAELGGSFGDHPVSGYFWGKAMDLATPIRFVCAMGLTFESANLDHAVEYAAAARRHGDEATAAIIEKVHDDEVGHVKFGWHWLAKWKDVEQTMEEAYCANVTWPLRPALAKGPVFHPESRRAAGMDRHFIEMVADADTRLGDC
jgi:uncharacterized ferritin-like protein (DUF455 family)